MALRMATGAVVLLHLLFIAAVVGGGLLVARWPRLAWGQIPVFLWGAVVNLAGWPCPLTTLENELRVRAGATPYPGSFVGHYLWPQGAPTVAGLPAEVGIGLVVLLVNLAVYAYLLLRRRRGAPGAKRAATESLPH